MYPDWVIKHKKKGTNISRINGRYYLYAVTSVWNKEKGRAQMVNKGYLGRITEDGFIPKGEKKPKQETPVDVKEYGATNALYEMSGDILEGLKEVFGADGITIYVMALLRLLRSCPFKRMELSYRQSYLSEIFPNIKFNAREISEFLRRFGGNREKIVKFMSGFIGSEAHILFDGTGIISKSDKMDINRTGYNAHREFDPQLNLMYGFSLNDARPAYYRIVAGNIRDVTAFKLCLKESGIENMVVVADKGFSSEANFSLMEESGLKYIIPLKRSSSLFDTQKLRLGDKSVYDGYFLHEKRPIWHYSSNGIMVFLDPDLKTDEEKSYIQKIEAKKDGYSKEAFLERQHLFGSIAFKTNLSLTPQEVYTLYKQRREIEQSFDFLKNLLEQDKSFMQNEKSLETWAFINHISLILCYKIYNLLREKKLISKYSVADFLDHLKYVSKVKIDGVWLTSEITKQSRTLLSSLGLHIT